MHRTNTEFKNRYIHSIIQAQIFSSLNELSFRSTFSIKKKKEKKNGRNIRPIVKRRPSKNKKKNPLHTSSSFDKHRFRHTSSRKR